MAGERRDKRRADDDPVVEDTQPLLPGMATRRDVIKFAREIVEKNPRRPGDGLHAG